ncbi:MAG: winged helix-turn-helix transcriptional regulator [Candidatus Thorarchaeota archaeon]
MPDGDLDSELHDKVKKLWDEISDRIESRFGLESSAYQNLTIAVEHTKPEVDEGAWCDNRTLYLTKSAIDGTLPMKAVLSLIYMRMILSGEQISDECIDDFSMEFARQMTKGTQQRNWVRWWKSQLSSRVLSTVSDYDPSVSFPLLYDLVGEKGLDTLMREILAMSKYGVVLDYEDFVTFLQTRFPRFSVNLSPTDLRIINSLLKNDENSYTAIADQIGISVEWVSRRISSLRRHFVLRRFEHIPFSKIGIRLFHLFLGSDNNALRYISNCPFLYAYQKVLTGRWSGFATLAVPDNNQSMKSIKDFLHLMQRRIESVLIEIESSGTINCFDFYDGKEGCWAIPWNLLAIHIRKIHDADLASAFPRVDSPACKTRLHLDSLDIRILNQVRMGVNSVAKIRAALEIGQERASRRLNQLRESGLIVTTWEVHNIGLNEGVIVVSDDIKTGESIAAWAQRLPRCIVSFDKGRRLVMIAQLPAGGSHGLPWALSSLSENLTIEVLGTKIYGGYGFPDKLWNSHKQRWECPEDEIEKWLGSII